MVGYFFITIIDGHGFVGFVQRKQVTTDDGKTEKPTVVTEYWKPYGIEEKRHSDPRTCIALEHLCICRTWNQLVNDQAGLERVDQTPYC